MEGIWKVFVVCAVSAWGMSGLRVLGTEAFQRQMLAIRPPTVAWAVPCAMKIKIFPLASAAFVPRARSFLRFLANDFPFVARIRRFFISYSLSFQISPNHNASPN